MKFIFIICNNDQLLYAVESQEQARKEIIQLREEQVNQRCYYHYQLVEVRK